MKQITNQEEFMAVKREILKKVMPHEMDPESYPPARLSLDECGILLAKTVADIPTRAAMFKREHAALEKLKQGLDDFGVGCIADII